MASIYSQAIGSSAKIMDEKVKAAGQAQKQGVDAQSFAIDKTEEFNEKATKASKKYGSWKKALGFIAGGAATAIGLGPLAAAAMAGGGTFLGGKIGEAAAGKDLTGRWMQSNQEALKAGMKKSTLSSAIMSGMMAGVSAGAADKAGKTAQEAAGAGGEFATYTGTAEQNKKIMEGLTGEAFDPKKGKAFEQFDQIIKDGGALEKGAGAGNTMVESTMKMGGRDMKVLTKGPSYAGASETGSIAEALKGTGEFVTPGKTAMETWKGTSDSAKEALLHKATGIQHSAGEFGYKNLFSEAGKESIGEHGVGTMIKSNLANTFQGWKNLAGVGTPGSTSLMQMAGFGAMAKGTALNPDQYKQQQGVV